MLPAATQEERCDRTADSFTLIRLMFIDMFGKNEDGLKIPCNKLQGIFDCKECGLYYDSLAYPAANGGECARFCGSG
jgi:hypothetical protein